MVEEFDMRLNFRSVMYTFKRYLQFSPTEIRAVVISILILTFIVAFNDKSETFRLSAWTMNYLKWLIIVTVSFTTLILAQRAVALYSGYLPEYRLWWYGLMFGLIIAFVSRGHIWLLMAGGMHFAHSSIHRTGEFRHGQTVWLLSKCSLAGPIGCLVLGIIVKTMQVWFGLSVWSEQFVHEFYLFNMALAAYSLLPIPPLPGSKVFFHSRLIYAFIAGSFIAYSILVIFQVYSLIWALLIGLVVYLLFWLIYERGAWTNW